MEDLRSGEPAVQEMRAEYYRRRRYTTFSRLKIS
jgi:hypothetical protein